MSGFLRNKKLIGFVLGGIFLLITLTVGVFAALGPEIFENTEEVSSFESSDAESSFESSESGFSFESSELESSSEEENSIDESSSQEMSSSDASGEEELPELINKPDEMRAAYLVPGIDFMTSEADSDEEIKAEIDSAIENAKNLTMNTIVADTQYENLPLWSSETLTSVKAGFNVILYLVQKARENGMYIYTVYHAADIKEGDYLKKASRIDHETLDEIGVLSSEFASLVQPDGILLDDYCCEKDSEKYSDYLKNGGGMGFENYLRLLPETAVCKAAASIRETEPHIQIGLLTEAVWANQSSDDSGSQTDADFEMLFDGNADIRAYLQKNIFNFVAVKAYGALEDTKIPFENVVSWWADETQANAVDFYVVHAANKAGKNEEGWKSKKQLANQVAECEAIGFEGSIFYSLKYLLDNPDGSTDSLLKYYNHEIDEEVIRKELTVVKPVDQAMTTKEPTVIFSGASDPEEPVFINDKEIKTDAAGYFSVSLELKPGENIFVIRHKEKELTYTINRVVQIIQKVSPEGSLTVEGNMKVALNVYAYEGSTVQAVIGGRTIPLALSEIDGEDTETDSAYKKYSGEFTVPAATGSVQNLGNIEFSASWQGIRAQKTGANVQVNRKPVVSSGKLVQVIAESAETFPTDVLNDNSVPDCFPLPKGTLDYAVGNELTWSDGSTVFKYYILASGNRVYSSDIAPYSGDIELEGNKINGITVQSDARYTKVILNTDKKVPYTAHYSGSSFEITFSYTGTVPASMDLNRNPLFTAANWSGHTLKLSLKTNGGFLGYKAFYDSNDNLVFRFNNPAVMQISNGVVRLNGTSIVIDPGHSTKDPGALGFLPEKPEYYINYHLALKLKSILESMGATVNLVNTTTAHPYLEERMAEVKSFAPHLLMSLHSNAADSTARGAECYYFNDYSRSLAVGVSNAISSALETTNRGAKFGYFYMTRDSEFPSGMTECGFVTNQEEYRKLIDDGYQQEIAQGIANAIVTYFKNTGSLVGTITGTQSSGEVQSVKVESVTLSQSELTMALGEKASLTAEVKPDTATNRNVVWTSLDSSVVSVKASVSDSNAAVLEAKKAGSTVIYAKSEDGQITAECTVTVVSEEVE